MAGGRGWTLGGYVSENGHGVWERTAGGKDAVVCLDCSSSWSVLVMVIEQQVGLEEEC
jgi:hypothetical protein